MSLVARTKFPVERNAPVLTRRTIPQLTGREQLFLLFFLTRVLQHAWVIEARAMRDYVLNRVSVLDGASAAREGREPRTEGRWRCTARNVQPVGSGEGVSEDKVVDPREVGFGIFVGGGRVREAVRAHGGVLPLYRLCKHEGSRVRTRTTASRGSRKEDTPISCGCARAGP